MVVSYKTLENLGISAIILTMNGGAIMYKLCKTEQSAVRQRQLEEGLLAAMETRPYEEISVSDLCDQLDIPRKSFYRYFTGKDGALYALLDHTLMEFDDYAIGYQQGRVQTINWDLESYFLFWKHHRKLLDALARSALTGMLIERAIAYALTDGILPKHFLPGDSQEMQQNITTFAVCGMMSMILTWHYGGFKTPAREMARIAARMLSQPLFPQAEQYL